MQPIKFKEVNKTYAENQPQYIPLPSYVGNALDNKEGDVVFCMGLSFKERVKILFTGRLWCSLRMFRDKNGYVNPLTPSRFSVYKKDFTLTPIHKY